MRNKLAALTLALLFFSVTAAFSAPLIGHLMPWKPVDPAELASKTPKVEKDADAEAILWEGRVLDEVGGSDYVQSYIYYYVCIKIYTERGKESQGTVNIPFEGRTTISDIAGRTIKPDGTILDLAKDAVFERVVAKASGYKERVKSFAMPGVEPGAIIEYRWRETTADAFTHRVLYFQHDIPVQVARFHVHPLSWVTYTPVMHVIPFNCQNPVWAPEANDYSVAELTNIPALREEPYMPPDQQVRQWMLVYTTETNQPAPEKFWQGFGKELFGRYKPLMKVNGTVRSTAEKIIAGASTPEEKLKRLFDYCRITIKNIDREGSGLTPEQRKDLKENKSPEDTIRQGAGKGWDIDLLFGALATAAGFDARVAKVPNRGQMFFRPAYTYWYFIPGYDIAVRVNDHWQFFDPASTYVSFGMLSWREEAVPALVTDPKQAEFITTPLSPPEKSAQARRGTFQLHEDGTLEGTVRIEYTGHSAARQRESIAGETAVEREEHLRDQLKERLSTIEMSELKVENIGDTDKPLVYSYKVRVPEYAERTGKRLFVQPAFFQRGLDAMFTASERKYPIYFHYPWSESDSVSIELPAGFSLDNAESPASLGFGDAGKYQVKLTVSPDRRTLTYSREFAFGNGGAILYEANLYPQLKKIFNVIHERDNHVVTLRQMPLAAK